MMKLNSMVVIMILAYIITVSYAREAEGSDYAPYIEIGTLIIESDASMGSVGVAYKDMWQLNRTFIGEGKTEWGTHPKIRFWSVDRLINPGWYDGHVFMLLGVAKLDTEFLVEPWNYHVGGGWKWDTGMLYLHHVSSGGINNNNTGFNMGTVRFYF